MPGAPPVPEVVMVGADFLVTGAVAQAARGPEHEEVLGRALATLHRAPLEDWGGGSSGSASVGLILHVGPTAAPSTAPDSASSAPAAISTMS